MPTPIIFPASSAPGIKPQESGGRLINAFAEKAPLGAPSQIIIRRSPGLDRVVTSPYMHTRGFIDIGQAEAFWILNERVMKFNAGFITTDLGPLAGDEPVTIARNNAVTPNFVVVTDQGCFNLFPNTAPTAFASIDLPASPTSVCDFDGYFVWSFGDGRIFTSDLNSVNVDPLSFNTEQGLFIRRVVRYAGRLYAFGDKWTGVYNDAGTQPFPLGREVTIPRGIIGTHAVAGWEAGWANELIWVGDDFVVYKLSGYTPTPISNNAVSRAIQEAVLAREANLIEAFVYMFENNAFWVLSCHGRWTWEYNLFTGEWNERISYNHPNWRGMKSHRKFDRWIIGDEYTGNLYGLSGTSFLEDNEPLVWRVESGVLTGFPMGMIIPRASFNITTGVGYFPGNDAPKIEISWSLDGGHSYGDPVIRRLGGPGQTKSHPYVLNSGLSKGQGVRYRLVISDPVHVGLSNGMIDVAPRAYSG